MANPTTNLNITLPEPAAESSRGTWGTTLNDAIQSLDTAIVPKTGGAFTGAVTMPSPVINTGVSGSAVKDEDNMSSDSATHIATQQSIKAYVDAQVTASDLDFQGDSGGALSIDLDSEVFDIAGGTGIDTTGSGNEVSVAIDSTVTTLAGSQTLTSKTLTSPVLNTGVSGSAILDSDTMSGTSATTLSSSESIKAYVDSQTHEAGDVTSVVAGSGLTGGGVTGDVTLNVIGGTGITANADDIAIDSTVATLAGTQTFTGTKTLTAPLLGTPTSGVMTNVTGTAAGLTAGNVTTNATLTGHVTSSGNATTLGSFTVAQLSSALSDASISGNNTGDLTNGIANTNNVVIDHASVADDDYAKFTSSGLEGRSATEAKTDFSLNNVENTALSTWAGTSNIATVGTVGTGTWQGTAVADAYIASASTWNAKESAGTGVAMAIALG